jgi:crossover junction endodeoxyribonuclease RuvC
MLIIGFDPGSISFGVGILQREKKRIGYVHSEEIKLKGGDFFSKMQILWEKLGRLYQEFAVTAAAMEEGFLGENVRSMSLLSMVRGVTMASLIVNRTPLRMYSPREAKLALTGYGNASKSQVKRMVETLLDTGGRDLGADESDALAVAYCHAMKMK